MYHNKLFSWFGLGILALGSGAGALSPELPAARSSNACHLLDAGDLAAPTHTKSDQLFVGCGGFFE